MMIPFVGISILSGFFLGRIYAAFFKQEIYQRCAHGVLNWGTVIAKTVSRHTVIILLGLFILRFGYHFLAFWVGSFLTTFWYSIVYDKEGMQ